MLWHVHCMFTTVLLWCITVTVSNHQQMLAFELFASNLDGLFPLQYGGHNIHDFRKHLKCGLVPFCVISDELRHRQVGCVSGSCWYIAFALHGRVLTCICRGSDELCGTTMVRVHVVISFMSVLNEVLSEGSLVFNVGFWPCPLFKRFLQILRMFSWCYIM